MCSSVTLHHNEHGYVTWCKSCDYISIAFGNVIMTVLPGQVMRLMKILSHDIRRYKNKISEKEKAFIYHSDSDSMRLILNYAEINQLSKLLGQSMLMYEANLIISG
jgi:hypothetical protein